MGGQSAAELGAVQASKIGLKTADFLQAGIRYASRLASSATARDAPLWRATAQLQAGYGVVHKRRPAVYGSERPELVHAAVDYQCGRLCGAVDVACRRFARSRTGPQTTCPWHPTVRERARTRARCRLSRSERSCSCRCRHVAERNCPLSLCSPLRPSRCLLPVVKARGHA
jgi:hypothetical protein